MKKPNQPPTKDFVFKGHLKKIATRIKPLYKNDAEHEFLMQEFQARLADRQNLLFADRRQGVLVILQGMDASGKDGAIKHVMAGLNPLGVRATAFGVPSAVELRHDFLWRTHARAPARGQIGIFNRSYYEEVITVRVHPKFLAGQNLPRVMADDRKFWRARHKDIVHFEEYLSHQGILVLKFYLHLSKSEQRERLLKRIDDRKKNWKFSAGDLDDRKLWSRFMDAYDDCFKETSTKAAPWYIIPADDKKNARLLISSILASQLDALDVAIPEPAKTERRELQRLRGQLE